MQFRDDVLTTQTITVTVFSNRDGSSRTEKKTCSAIEKLEQHTAVVGAVDGSGVLMIFEQNVRPSARRR